MFFVDLPSKNGRLDILKKLTKNGTCPRLGGDVDLNVLAERTEGFSGADLVSLVDQAAEFRMEEILRGAPEEAVLCWEDFERALKLVRPSVTGSQVRHI